MERWIRYLIIVVGMCFIIGYSYRLSAEEKPGGATTVPKIADGNAALGPNHPKIAPGASCNDCHQLKLDAKSSATQVFLYGEFFGKKPGEGIAPKERVWAEIVKVLRVMPLKRTYSLATSYNNAPLSTSAEFALDPEKKMLYGIHEIGTEKLMHIKNNPRVSLTWHREFESFATFLGLQVMGTAVLIDSTNPEFDKILDVAFPYESTGGQIPADADAQTRANIIKKYKDGMKAQMVISKITMEQVTIMASEDFMADGFRIAQRWKP